MSGIPELLHRFSLLILSIVPGPTLFERQPEIVGGIFLVDLAFNAFLLVAGILVMPLFVYVLSIPKSNPIPIVLVLCSIGTFALQASVFDLMMTLAFGLAAVLFRTTAVPPAPVVIGIIPGPFLEKNLCRAHLISRDGSCPNRHRDAQKCESSEAMLNWTAVTDALMDLLRSLRGFPAYIRSDNDPQAPCREAIPHWGTPACALWRR